MTTLQTCPGVSRERLLPDTVNSSRLIFHFFTSHPQYPVLLEVDDAMEAVSAVVEPLLESGKARLRGAETLVVSD
ncbi:hypothetical protein ACVWY0_004220 [Arthrobacter sp. UYNi723]